MNLDIATIDQLVKWQADIVAEIAYRAASGQYTVAARPPWEMEAPQHRPAPQRPPAMLARPQPRPEIAPGVRTTDRTDPALAARFAMTPVRNEGVPGHGGNGRGEGEVSFGDG